MFNLHIMCFFIEKGNTIRFILPEGLDVMTEGRAMIDTAMEYDRPEFLKKIIDHMIANLPPEGTLERAEKVEDITDYIEMTFDEFNSDGKKISPECMRELAFFIQEKDPHEMSSEELEEYLKDGEEAASPGADLGYDCESKEHEAELLGTFTPVTEIEEA